MTSTVAIPRCHRPLARGLQSPHPQLPPQKRKHIRLLVNPLPHRSPHPMPSLPLHPQQNRPLRNALHQCRHLKSMHRINPRIRIRSHKQDSRIFPSLNMVIRRISIKPLKLLRILRAPILRNPKPGNLKILVMQHVEQWHLADHSPKQIRTLSNHRPHQQSAIRPPGNGQMIRVRILLCNQKRSRRNHVIKNILLLAQHPSPVPVFPKLRPPAQISHGINPATLQP